MEKVNILIIGAGAVGLSIAKVLSVDFEDVVVVETENSFGRHTSSRNSEVIHSGIYYPQNSLKAKFCVEGEKLLYDFCQKNEIPFKNCGKLVVATSEDEIPNLQKLKENGERNGVQGLEIISGEKCLELEPQIKAVKGLFVPSTGIVDTHKLMQNLERVAEENDAFIVYEMEVVSIAKEVDCYSVHFANGEVFEANIVINSAGLFAENIAKMVGMKTKKHKMKIHWCKGEYYKTSKITNINHLVYPLPDPKGIYLGIHLTINMNDEVRFGPNAYYVNDINYAMNESSKPDFLKAINKYIAISEDDLHPDDTGIRAKLQGPKDGFRDFYIRDESDKGFEKFINLLGIESPGLTSCLAIAEYLKDIVASVE